MGEDVDGFRRLLSGYKMTITVALTDASIRKAAVTAEAIQGYNSLLKTAKADLEGRLETIDDKLDLMLQSINPSESQASDIAQLKEERQSTESCLQICAQLSEHITQIQLANVRRPSGSTSENDVESSSTPKRITNEGLQECKDSLSRMATKLASHEKDLFNRLVEKLDTGNLSDAADDIARLRDEWEATRHSMDLLTSASNHLEEKVSVIENYATGDAVQFMVSTTGKVLHGKNQGLGWRTRQVGGYMDDETVKQISRDMSGASLQNRDSDESAEVIAKGAREAEFQERYGDGFKLTTTKTLA